VAVSATAQMDERWQLVAPHRERLLRLLQTRCTTHQDAEDCAHEAMLRVATFEHLDHDRAGQMLTVVAMRLAVDQHRQPQRRRAALRRLFASTVARSPEDVALDRLDAMRMLGHADQLGAHERSVLMLRAQGIGAADVAGELGVTYKSVEGAYTRARRKLRAAAGATVALGALGLRHLLRGAATTPAMAAVVAALAVLAVPVPSAARSGPTQAPVDSAVRSAHRIAPAGASLQVPSRIAAVHAPPVATSTPAPTTPRGGSAPVQISAIDVRAAGVGAPVAMHRSDADQTFTQSLMQCVTGGPSLDPTHLGCRP
jgi:RNA polymerase sigma factor (sigma-70 family)